MRLWHRAALNSSGSVYGGQVTTHLFAKANNLNTPSKKAIGSMDLGPAQIGALISDSYKSPTLLKKFCGYFYDNQRFSNDKALCERDPQRYLETTNTEHVMRLLGDARIKSIEPLKSGLQGLAVNAGFGVAKSESHDVVNGWTAKASIDAGISGKILGSGFLGISTGLGLFHTESSTKRNSSDVTVDGGVDKKLDVETIILGFDAEVQKCLLVTPARNLRYARPKQSNSFLCLDDLERKSVQENYYFLYQNYFPGVLLDTGANSKERQTILIRGENRFQEFTKLVQDKTLEIDFKNGAPVPAAILKATMDRYDGYFPGLLSQ